MGPLATGNHGATVSSPILKPHQKKPMKRYQGHLMGPPTNPGPRIVPECLIGQSAP
ncbi:unnamed protein product, partial [Staurois parvus]